MRSFTFKTVTALTAAAIWLSDLLFGVTVNLLVFVSANLRILIARLGYCLMRWIDAEAIEHIEEENEQEEEAAQHNLELKLLHAATQVRDHARQNEEWTSQHSEALQAIGNSLFSEMGWEESDVHAYLKEIVESIDGLTYESPEE